MRVVIAAIFVACIADASSHAADCNGNEREDDSDIRSGVSLDCNLNEVPDECEALLPKLELDHPLPLLAVPGISSLLVSEFNGDGRPDIAMTRGETAEMGAGLTVLLGSPSNGNGSPRHIDGPQFESMITFDYEADGDIDILGIIITGNVEASIVVIANPGSGGPLEIAHLAEVTRGTLSLSDLDGDGSTDLAILGAPGFRVLRGRPGGRFAETADTIAARFHDSPGFGVDWDRDGFGDVVSSSGDDICVFHGGSALELNCETLRLAPASTLDPVERFLVADLDGDALPDLAEKRRDSEWLRVGLQDQSGRLASVHQYDVGGFIGSMLAEDATLSGHRDLFLIRSALAGGVADDVMMLHGLGAGRLGLAETYPTARGSRALGVADFTGDGLPDLVLAENDLGSVRVWPQRTGQGTFDCDGNALLDSCELDCNLDGVADACEILAAPERDGDGNGFLDACEPDCNANGVPDATEIAGGASKDCDQDGMPDECQTRAELRIPLPQRIPIGESFSKVGGVDVDLDSDVDLVVASSQGNVIRVVRNDGHRRWSVVQSFPLAHSYRGIDSVELDGVPGPDILLVRAGGLDLILNNGQGGFHVGGSLRPPGEEPENFTAGYVVDYDLDGVLDVVVSRSEPGEIGVFPGEGGGMFFEYRALADNVLGSSVKSEDMNGDGRPDVITGSSLLLQNVMGGLVPTPTLPVGAEVCIDTNGDGLIDLLQADSNQGLLLGRNGGGGRFDPAVILAVPGGVAPYVLLDAGDFDGDGISDIVGRGRDGGLMVLRGGFPGAPRSAAWYDGYPTSVALADLDGDSRLDLAMISSHDSAVTLLHGQVGGALSGVPASPVSWTPLFLGGDLDGDGLVDLVTGEGADSVVTLRGAGDGSFSRRSMFTATTTPLSPGSSMTSTWMAISISRSSTRAPARGLLFGATTGRGDS